MEPELAKPYIIRAATQEDVKEIVRLNAFVQTLHVDAHPERFRTAAADDCIELFGSLLSEPVNRFWLAVASGKAAGYVWARLEHRPQTALKHGITRVYLDQICVDPACRGQGIGGALINEVIAYAAEQGVREVALDTWAFNDSAQRFFARQGFEVYRHDMWRRW